MIDRLYFNITNHCNYACPFCCMSSSPKGQRFLSFRSYQEIIDSHHKNNLEIQLEGGEPTLHPDFFLIVEYALSLPFVEKVIIDSNGFNINKIINILVEIASRRKKEIFLKLSDNNFIRKQRDHTPDFYKNLISALEFVEYFKIKINLRAYSEEELEELLMDYKPINSTKDFTGYVSAFTFNRYGRLSNNEDLPEPIINKTVNQFYCISSDGLDFGEDLIKRAEWEATLIK